MKILAMECSATAASAAVIEEGKILASAFVNVKLTHSETLLPMIEAILAAAHIGIEEIGGLAVAAGPGSFTGIRIGISAAKGIAAPRDLPCVGVSTLYAMAHNAIGQTGIVCTVMDARCGQVYGALFEAQNGRITRLCEDEAVLCEVLAEKLKKVSQNGKKCVIIIGDGAAVFAPFVKDLPGAAPAPEKDRFQNAVSVALAAEPLFAEGKTVPAEQLLPVYLRLPQAERELRRKKGETI